MRQIKWNSVEFRERELRPVHVFWWSLYKSDVDCTDKVSSCRPYHFMSFAVLTARKLWQWASRHCVVPWVVTSLSVKPASFLFYPEDGGNKFLGNVWQPSLKLHDVTTLKTTQSYAPLEVKSFDVGGRSPWNAARTSYVQWRENAVQGCTQNVIFQSLLHGLFFFPLRGATAGSTLLGQSIRCCPHLLAEQCTEHNSAQIHNSRALHASTTDYSLAKTNSARSLYQPSVI